MSRPRRLTVCTQPGCPTLTDSGRCDKCRRDADAGRGTAAERGYGGRAWRVNRRAVLRRDRVCVICHDAPATVSDHYPQSRKELLALGVTDPDAPHRMRGLCQPCHSRETAQHQPGGWNQDR